MLRVNGFYGHVRLNDLRSLAMFAGFVVAFQIVAAATLFLPLLFLDARHAPIYPFAYAGRYVPVVFVAGMAFFVLRFTRHVASVRATVTFRDVSRRTEPRLVNIVETLAIAAGLPAPKVGVIESEARNAFACGLSPASAVVVVTRGLLEALDDDELAAVVAHEIAHISNGDIRLMAAANVMMENLDNLQRRNLLRGVGWKQAVVVVLFPALMYLIAMSGYLTRIAFTIARVSRLLISSSREFVADAEAVRLTHNPAALISALRRIEGRSAVAGLGPQADAMMIDGAVEGPYATHPTVAERIAVLARLAGSWVDAETVRKDTRTALTLEPGRGPWGRAEPAASVRSPARRLYERVNAGENEKLYAVSPAARWIIGLGLALIVGTAFLSASKLNAHLARTAPKKEAEIRLRNEGQRLSRLPPAQARCFATETYSVGDRGLHRLRPLDPGLVAAYARGEKRDDSDIVPERYLGWKQASVRRVTAGGSQGRDEALLAYVKTRKIVLEVMHRFFGEPGIRLAEQAYASPEDGAVLATLRQRLEARAPGLGADPRLEAEMRFLVSEPDSFVPCAARAAQTRR